MSRRSKAVLRAQRRLWSRGEAGRTKRGPELQPWLARRGARWRWAVRSLPDYPVSIEGFLHAYYSEALALDSIASRPSPLLERLRREGLAS